MQKCIQNTLLVCLGLLFGITTAEISLSLARLPRFYQAHSSPPQFTLLKKDGVSFYVNKPSSNIQFIYDGNPRGYFGEHNEVNHRTNSWGFRGKEFSYRKPAGRIRIVFLGDYFTFGEGVKFEDTYSEKTATLLSKEFASENISFESYNFGVGGDTIFTIAFFYLRIWQ